MHDRTGLTAQPDAKHSLIGLPRVNRLHSRVWHADTALITHIAYRLRFPSPAYPLRPDYCPTPDAGWHSPSFDLPTCHQCQLASCWLYPLGTSADLSCMSLHICIVLLEDGWVSSWMPCLLEAVRPVCSLSLYTRLYT